ncbi:MAG: hypothetical protein ACTSV7_00565 [Candidatus Baldrarchaeia archaeon]
MKFETKFGLGEIVIHKIKNRSGGFNEEVLEVVGISVTNKHKPEVAYICRYPQGLVGCFYEEDLIGDPAFDSELGFSPEYEQD